MSNEPPSDMQAPVPFDPVQYALNSVPEKSSKTGSARLFEVALVASAAAILLSGAIRLIWWMWS